MQLPRAHTLNIRPSNSKLQVVIPSNQPTVNQFARHMTPPSTIGHAPRYPPTTLTHQTYTPQTQFVITQRNDANGNINMWPASQNDLASSFNRKTLQPIQGSASPDSSVSSQHTPEIPSANLNVADQNIHNNFATKEPKNHVPFDFLGEDPILSPISNRPDGLRTTPSPPPKNLIGPVTGKQIDTSIVNQLKGELETLKRELEAQKEKNKVLQNTQKSENKNLEPTKLKTEKKKGH